MYSPKVEFGFCEICSQSKLVSAGLSHMSSAISASVGTMQDPRKLLPKRVPSSTSSRSNRSGASALPYLSPRLDVDTRKYEGVMQVLLFPIAETRRQARGPPQRLIQDVKSLLLQARHAKRSPAKFSAAVRSLLETARSPRGLRKVSTTSQRSLPAVLAKK